MVLLNCRCITRVPVYSSRVVNIRHCDSFSPNAISVTRHVLRALKPMRVAFLRVIKLYQLALTLPVSTASCERSLSCIKRIKTYIRTTMTEGRLTGHALMSIENELTKTDKFLNEVLEKFKNQGGLH
jgi:hAT family C-terminal dimerisation region